MDGQLGTRQEVAAFQAFGGDEQAAAADKDGDGSQVHGDTEALAAIVVPAAAEVIPSAGGLRQIDGPGRDIGFRDGADEQRRTEHILRGLLQGLAIRGEVEEERTHERVAVEGHARGA